MFIPSRPPWLEILCPNKNQTRCCTHENFTFKNTTRWHHPEHNQLLLYSLLQRFTHTLVTATQRSLQDNEGAETGYRNTYTLHAKLCKWHPPGGARHQTNDSWRLCNAKCSQNSQLTPMLIVQWSCDTDLLYGPKWRRHILNRLCPARVMDGPLFFHAYLWNCAPRFLSCYQV